MKTLSTILRYTPEQRDAWDAFVATSRNGTFLLQRGFMDYHADRFTDHSLMFYTGRQLVALLPAEEHDGCLTSHRGLTYGGLILSDKATTAIVVDLMRALVDYLRALGNIRKLVYSPIPAFYATYPSEEDRYALFRLGARWTQSKVTSVIPTSRRYPLSTLRRRKVNLFKRMNLSIVEDRAFADFWAVLTQNLELRHATVPVHTVGEISLLEQRFPEHIHLHRVVNAEGATVGGAVVFETATTAHVQYIGSTQQGREQGALDGLFAHLIGERYAHKAYFDFGVSVEQGGRILNEGLIRQKESFGARAATYDTFEISITPED